MAAVTHCALFFFPIDEEEVEHKAPERIRDGTEERILKAVSIVAALKMLVDVRLADGDVRRTAALREHEMFEILYFYSHIKCPWHVCASTIS